MKSNQLQLMFFQTVKSKLAPHISLVDEVAETLGISNDSAYRRIRGEKEISLEEISKLASHFKLSVDQILNLKSSDSIIFSGRYINPENFNFEMWQQETHKHLQYIASFKNKQLIFNCKDIVVFHYFAFPELATFKNFVWMKTLLQYPQFRNLPFDFDNLQKRLLEVGDNITRLYTKIPGIEIMQATNIETTLNQIEYYKAARMFKSQQDLSTIYTQLHQMLHHLEAQAEAGVRYMHGEKPNSQSAEYKLYVTDFIVGDNSSIAILENTKVSYIVHNTINYLVTADEQFTNYHYEFLQNIIKKSILLSTSGEKLRSSFFYVMHEAIEKSRENKLVTFGTI